MRNMRFIDRRRIEAHLLESESYTLEVVGNHSWGAAAFEGDADHTTMLRRIHGW
jgi:hypothetical protein